MFELVSALAKKAEIIDLKLCSVRLEDNRFYPWVLLIPMREGVKNMTFLSMDDRLQLMREVAVAENVMSRLFSHDQMNVAMIGNVTPQLHVHVLCRKIGDPDWPSTVWNSRCEPYAPEDKERVIAMIRQAIDLEKNNPEYNQNDC